MKKRKAKVITEKVVERKIVKGKIIKGTIIKDPKARGEWVESLFLARASEEGLTVSKPWGESKRFDFVVGRPPHFVSVQVKCTTVFLHSGYPVAVRHGNERYARGSFDFLAGYVVPEDAWYIIPAEKFAGIARLTLCSTSDEARYEEFREAWHLLREAVGVHRKDVHEEDAPQAADETRDAGGKPVDRFPTNIFERMQEVSRFVRKQMQRSGMVPDVVLPRQAVTSALVFLGHPSILLPDNSTFIICWIQA